MTLNSIPNHGLQHLKITKTSKTQKNRDKNKENIRKLKIKSLFHALRNFYAQQKANKCQKY